MSANKGAISRRAKLSEWVRRNDRLVLVIISGLIGGSVSLYHDLSNNRAYDRYVTNIAHSSRDYQNVHGPTDNGSIYYLDYPKDFKELPEDQAKDSIAYTRSYERTDVAAIVLEDVGEMEA